MHEVHELELQCTWQFHTTIPTYVAVKKLHNIAN